MKRDIKFELEAVLAIADARNFRAAAQEMGLSPSAMSHAVSALEGRLGVRLFHRTTRSVLLTPAGEHFVSRIRPALHELRGAIESINDFRDTPRGVLRLNTSEPWARQLFTPVIVEYLHRYPEVSVELACESRYVDIVKEGFDAGIRLRDTVPADMVAVVCSARQRNIVVATPAFVRKNGTPKTPQELLDVHCIVMRKSNGGRYHWEFERDGRALEIDVKGRIALDTMALVIDAALAGLGFAYVGDEEVADLLARKRLVRVLEPWCVTWEPLAIYYPGHRQVPATLRAFIDVAKRALKTRRARRAV
jgi:DNA-binding transcriptional LysR family regulator